MKARRVWQPPEPVLALPPAQSLERRLRALKPVLRLLEAREQAQEPLELPPLVVKPLAARSGLLSLVR